MVKETWTTVWAEVKVSNLGNFDFNGEKIKAIVNKKQPELKRYDKPTLVKVKMNIGSAGNNSRKRQIICVDTNEVFESLRAASKHTKICAARLCGCLKGNMPDTRGYRWAYYTE